MNKIPDRKVRKAGESLVVFLVFVTLASMAFALDFKYPAKVERVIDGDTIVADLTLGLGVILDDQYIRFYGIDAWGTRGIRRNFKESSSRTTILSSSLRIPSMIRLC